MNTPLKFLTEKQVKEYRECFINGYITIPEISKETGMSIRTITSMIYNQTYKDEKYSKRLSKLKPGDRFPFLLPIRKKYTFMLKQLFGLNNIPIDIKKNYIKETLCELTYDNQSALFIRDDEENIKFLLIIEKDISSTFGYLIPSGKYSIELIVEENGEYFSKFKYDVSDCLKVKQLSNYKNNWISEDGQLLSIMRAKLISKFINKKGYVKVSINKDNVINTFQIHRLVAEAFVPNPFNKPQVNHIDGNKQNNNYTNLEWVTNQENQIHAIKNKLYVPQFNEKANSAKLTNLQVRKIRELFITRHYTFKQLAKMYGVSDTAISYIVQYLTYPDATDPNEIPPYIPTNKKERKGEKSFNAVFTNEQIKQIRLDYYTKKYTIQELSNQHHVSSMTIVRILSYRTYKDATDPNEIPLYISRKRKRA